MRSVILVFAMSVVNVFLAQGQTSHKVDLSWNASVTPGVAGYNVYRATVSGGAGTKLNTGLVSGLTYSDTTVVACTVWYYTVTAVDGAGKESRKSNEVNAVIPDDGGVPCAPGNLKVAGSQ